jgi:Cys-rich repeat protein
VLRFQKAFFGIVCVCLSVWTAGCLVESACYNDADCASEQFCDKASGKCLSKCLRDEDCPEGSVCNLSTGKCNPVQCQVDADCDRGLECEEGLCVFCDPFRCNPIKCSADAQCAAGFSCTAERCVSAELACPEGMVSLADEFCIDIYEASRTDATESKEGRDSSRAESKEGVMPWVLTNDADKTFDENTRALRACEAAGKTLCTENMWYRVCVGPQDLIYAYGDDYIAEICNGIDKFCSCNPPSPCAGHDPCPYPHCRDDCPSYSDTPFHLEPTPTDPRCTNEYGTYDINGNLWEYVKGGDGTRIRGGAFNCADSVTLHRCDYIPAIWTPSARGFRCCSLGMPE